MSEDLWLFFENVSLKRENPALSTFEFLQMNLL